MKSARISSQIMSNFTEQPEGYLQYDYIEEDSDQEMRGRDSSDDELDILLNGTAQQKRRLTRSISRGSLELSSSEDEFEKEMEKELDETMRQHEKQFSMAAATALSNKASSSANDPSNSTQVDIPSASAVKEDDFYNDIYFDSDDEATEGDSTSKPSTSKQNKKSPGKHRILTNDELLYDPDIDDKNQEWIDKQRERYYPSRPSQGGSSSQISEATPAPEDEGAETAGAAVPRSDAVLNCPACMTTLCLDCQRHDLYTHQYRAMFVLNCNIIRTERLTYSAPQKTGRKKWRKKPKMQLERIEATAEGVPSSSAENQQEHFHPVQCSKCNTEVAVYDSDEVFHFFNVLTSLS